MNKTRREVLQFIQAATIYQSQNPDMSKLTYALGRVLQNARKIKETTGQREEDINMEACSIDKDGNLLKESDGSLKMSKDAGTVRNTKIRDLLNECVEIEPYYATALPKDLPVAFWFEFEGFVIKPFDEPKDGDKKALTVSESPGSEE